MEREVKKGMVRFGVGVGATHVSVPVSVNVYQLTSLPNGNTGYQLQQSTRHSKNFLLLQAELPVTYAFSVSGQNSQWQILPSLGINSRFLLHQSQTWNGMYGKQHFYQPSLALSVNLRNSSLSFLPEIGPWINVNITPAAGNYRWMQAGLRAAVFFNRKN